MLIENIKLLESFCEIIVDNADSIKTKTIDNFNNTDTESLFEDISESTSLDLITLNELYQKTNSVFDKLVQDYMESENIAMADLIKSIHNFIENNDLNSSDKILFNKRFLDFNYPIV